MPLVRKKNSKPRSGSSSVRRRRYAPKPKIKTAIGTKIQTSGPSSLIAALEQSIRTHELILDAGNDKAISESLQFLRKRLAELRQAG